VAHCKKIFLKKKTDFYVEKLENSVKATRFEPDLYVEKLENSIKCSRIRTYALLTKPSKDILYEKHL